MTKALRKDASRKRCRWTDDEDGQLVRLVMDVEYRAALCGVRKLRWDRVAGALGRWSADGHTVRHRFSTLEHWDGAAPRCCLSPSFGTAHCAGTSRRRQSTDGHTVRHRHSTLKQ